MTQYGRAFFLSGLRFEGFAVGDSGNSPQCGIGGRHDSSAPDRFIQAYWRVCRHRKSSTSVQCKARRMAPAGPYPFRRVHSILRQRSGKRGHSSATRRWTSLNMGSAAALGPLPSRTASFLFAARSGTASREDSQKSCTIVSLAKLKGYPGPDGVVFGVQPMTYRPAAASTRPRGRAQVEMDDWYRCCSPAGGKLLRSFGTQFPIRERVWVNSVAGQLL